MKQNKFGDFPLGRAGRPRRHWFLAIIGCCVIAWIVSSATAAVPHSPTWVRLSPATSPPARSYLAMTYDPASGKVIMFGGFDGTGYLNDTWTFDGTSWSRVQTSVSPPARAGSQMAYDATTQKVVLFGGENRARCQGGNRVLYGKTFLLSPL